MSFDILLDSSLAKQERGGERNVSHDFTVKFYPPIDLPTELGPENYKAALNRLITMAYSLNYKRINDYIQQQTGKVDPTIKNGGYIFTIYFNMAIYRVFI